ncbi:Vomeronasal type-2 receptor 26 [Fukomys damarensis]|uniref:Vomeronasal type-2 receptor 26 n=1 Tax=Fukomys damarensis TaxID=885580 RepID=A0A091D2E9_FUKDA|nr:Vomeronasal type-2 receptor 26 [Fukomys damarensis]
MHIGACSQWLQRSEFSTNVGAECHYVSVPAGEEKLAALPFVLCSLLSLALGTVCDCSPPWPTSVHHWRIPESTLILLTGQDEIPNYTCRRETKSLAVVTGISWGTSPQIGPLLELYKFPQVTYSWFDPMLSDSGQFPSLYQVAQKDTSLALGMVSLMLHFSWTWVGLVITEGPKGLQFLLENFHCSFSDSDCALENCTPNASLAWLPVNHFDMAMSDESHNVYNAVFAVAHALHEMLIQQDQMQPSGSGEPTAFFSWQLHHFLKKVHFNNPAGDQVTLDDITQEHAEQTTFGVVFTVAVSTILAKTITVVLAFKVTAPGRRMRQWLVSGAPNSSIPICSLIQLTLCGIWMGTNPPFVDTDAHSEHGHIIIVCNKGSLWPLRSPLQAGG